MRKSAVLKDLANRPAGYVLLSGGSAVCRAQLGKAAQLTLVYEDGIQSTHTLDGSNAEQRFPCEGKGIRGCCVFRGEDLLLVSDEAMRSAFERQACRRRNSIAAQCACLQEQEPAARNAQSNRPERNEDGEKQCVFAQRRWPPPPCWDAARYLDGCWREE